MTSLSDDNFPPDGSRIIDIGGLDADCEEDMGDGKNLVIFALDPGVASGWSALKVPVRRAVAEGASRILPRCRWRHGTVLRSPTGTGEMALSVSDSRHVSHILEVAGALWEEFVSVPDEDDDWEQDEFVFVFENFRLRMMSMDDNLLAPVRVLDRICDRLWINGSTVPVFFQSPSDAKRSVTDDRLKRWLMYDKSSGVHARDADRHAILFLRRFVESQELRSRLGFV